MARDYVTVANLATGFFGEDDQIREPNEDSKPARTVKAVWDEVRKFVLSKGKWDFALAFQSLAPVNVTIPGHDGAVFNLPANLRRLVAIKEPCDILWQRAGNQILADASELIIEYVQDVPDPARWSDEFTEAFAMRLAWQIADRLSGDKARKRDALDAYLRAIKEGKGNDAKQGQARARPEGEWSRARRSGVDRLLTAGRH